MFSKMRLAIILFSIPTLMACSSMKRSMNPETYLSWYASPNFGWKGIDTIQETMTCAMRLLPKEVTIAQCALESCETKETLQKRLSSMDETIDFIVEFTSLKTNISLFDLPGKISSSRADRVMYFSSGIRQDIKVLTLTGDTLECTGVLYEPAAPQKARILVSIEKSKKSMYQLLIKDQMISGEIIRFSIPELTYKTIPTLKL